MPLYIELSNAYLTVATDCTVSISTCSNSKETDLRKREATDLHVSAAQKFLFEVTGLSARNVDRVVCVTKYHAIDRCRYL